MSLPTAHTRESAQAYCDDCVRFGLEDVGVHDLGVPFMENDQADRRPRYRFLKAWGKPALDHGMVTSFPGTQLWAAVHGGRDT